MTRVLLVAALALLAGPAHASYTECMVMRDTSLAIRPNGPTENRYMPVELGDWVAYRNEHQGWWFVLHAVEHSAGNWSIDYGWLPRSILGACRRQEGTP